MIQELEVTSDNFKVWSVCCKVVASLFILGAFGDVLSVFAITVDRFICINFPFQYETWITPRRVTMVLVVGAIILATFAFVVIWLPDK